MHYIFSYVLIKIVLPRPILLIATMDVSRHILILAVEFEQWKRAKLCGSGIARGVG
jgi:hypothetical protein